MYTLNEIKVAAFNRVELSGLTANEKALWQGLAYCYDWFRSHPGEQEQECKQLAAQYIDYFWNKGKLVDLNGQKEKRIPAT